MTDETLSPDVAVIGGVATALSILRRGRTVVLTEPTAWLGGQLTSQGVPPDEHVWVEQFGVTRTYRALRDGIRAYYRAHYPLSAAARADAHLNPGLGHVSRLCHEPRAAVAVIDQLLAPYRSSGRLTVLHHVRPHGVDVTGDAVDAVVVRDELGRETRIEAPMVLDATETGDLLPLSGAESRAQTGEPQAAEHADPLNMQAVTVPADDASSDRTCGRSGASPPGRRRRTGSSRPTSCWPTGRCWTTSAVRSSRPRTRRRTSPRPGPSASPTSTGCRRRPRDPTADRAGRGCACVATSSAPATGSRWLPRSASRVASAPCGRSSNRTSPSTPAGRPSRPGSRTAWAWACTASISTVGCLERGSRPQEVASSTAATRELRATLAGLGVELHWPRVLAY